MTNFELIGVDGIEGETVMYDAVDVSDGYHTMSELYDHRRALTAALFRMISVYRRYPGGPQVYKSKLHNDGTMLEGYFVVSFKHHEKDQISYHYDLKYWDDFYIPEIERIPWEYDGHTSEDVIKRLLTL